MWNKHPLAEKSIISIDELEEYPCLAFEQGVNNSFYFAEEILSTYEYKRVIKADDRATMLNIMVGLNGFTLCSGIISEAVSYTHLPRPPAKVPKCVLSGKGCGNSKTTRMLAQKQPYIQRVRNSCLLYTSESVPGTAVHDFYETAQTVEFSVEGPEDAQITLGLEEEAEYEIDIAGTSAGTMKTNLGGKLSLSVELEDADSVEIKVTRK